MMDNKPLIVIGGIALVLGLAVYANASTKQRAADMQAYRSNPDNFQYPMCYSTTTGWGYFRDPMSGGRYIMSPGYNGKSTELAPQESWRAHRKVLTDLNCGEQ